MAMSAKGSRTVSDALNWNTAQGLIRKLERDNRPQWAMLIACGSYLGLRVGDLRQIEWEDLKEEKIKLIEGKTNKFRTLTVHPELKEIADRLKGDKTGPIFDNRRGGIITIQNLNLILHKIGKEYNVSGSFTSHSLRKTFGRRIWEANKCSERALVYLSKLFNHSSSEITRTYLGITSDEISDLYMSL